jgi:hypothetical protein
MTRINHSNMTSETAPEWDWNGFKPDGKMWVKFLIIITYA